MRRETSEIIRDFQSAKTAKEQTVFQFEIYQTETGRLMGYSVDEMSNKRLSAGYDNMWTLVRRNVRVVIVSNDKNMTQEHAIRFAKAYFDGRYTTYNIDLEKR